MALDNYSNLKISIASWLHRTDLTTLLDDFIALAEEMMWRDLRVKEMETDTTVTLSVSVRTVALPSAPIKIRRIYLNVTPIQKLLPKTASQIVESYNNATGKPRYYNTIGSTLEFERTPDSAYTLYVDYYKKLTALSSTNTTNDILTNYPSVYLWGSCLAGAIYSNDDKNIAKFKPLFDESVAKANAQTRAVKYGAGLAVSAA